MRNCAALAIIALACSSHAAVAQTDDDKAPTSPAAYEAVIGCEKVAEAAARLACFDRAVAALNVAVRDKQVAVIDRATVREARRGLFGLNLPRLNLFGRGDDAAEEIQAIDSTITAVSSTREGKSVFGLADGSRWRQTELRKVYAKVGQPIHIKRGAIGGYMATIENRGNIRVIRIIE